MSKPSFLGSLISKTQRIRRETKEKVMIDMLKRNHLDAPGAMDNHKIEEDKRVSGTGSEITSFKLWKLVDQTVIQIEPTVNSSVKIGLGKGEPDELHGSPQANPTESPL